jgi:hypothetical protein
VRDPATRPAPGDHLFGAWGKRRVAWVSEGLPHTVIGLEDDNGSQWAISYRDWQQLVLEADLVSPMGEQA